MKDADVLELRRLVHALEEERVSEREFGRLQEILRSGEAAREEYVRMVGVSSSLAAYADEVVQGDAEGDGAIVPIPGGWPLAAKLVAVVAVLLGIYSVYQLTAGGGNGGGGGVAPEVGGAEPPEEVTEAGLAVITKSVGAVWPAGGMAYGAGGRVPRGEFRMDAGLAQLEFYCGARAVVEGPLVMEVVEAKALRLERGTVRVEVPPHAEGFRVLGPGFEVVDLGTEFGVRAVDGEGEVQVFSGEVEVTTDSGEVKQLVEGGVFSTAGMEAAFAPDAYVGTAALAARLVGSVRSREEAWRAFVEEQAADRRLGLFYGFDGTAGGDRVLANGGRFDFGGADGAIVGARWSEGQWPGRRALDFKGPGDRVRVDVPGAYEAITLAAWVQVDGLDRKYNALFLTDDYKPGNPHWQIESDGRVAFGVKKRGEGRFHYVFWTEPVFDVLTAGHWVHLAVTFDTKTGRGAHYVNGEVAAEYTAPEAVDTRLVVGAAELGNWGLPREGDARPVRSLNGKMGTFWMYTEALGAAEVKRLFTAGNE